MNTQIIVGRHNWTQSHTDLMSYLVMEGMTTTAKEDYPELEKSMKKYVEDMTEKTAIIEMAYQLLSDQEIEALEDEARTWASNEPDCECLETRTEQLMYDLLYIRHMKNV